MSSKLSYTDITDEEWDVLIILDACRYDIFKEIYSKYFEGVLKLRISPGTCTPEWLVKAFPKRYYPNIVYVTANPYVNTVRPIVNFFKIVEVWRTRWNEELGTVHPCDVSIEAIKTFYRYPDKRLIVHYLQPHAPYILGEKATLGFGKPKPEKEEFFTGPWSANPLLTLARKRGLHKHLINIIRKLEDALDLHNSIISRIIKMLGLPPITLFDIYVRLYGVEGLRILYVKNLHIALKYVSMLVRNLSQCRKNIKIVITSDHGEFLGEAGAYGHWPKSSRSVLKIVPWLIVSRVKTSFEDPREIMMKRIVSIIRKLHSYDF